MNGKKMVFILLGVMAVACIAVIISIQLFFKYYEPKPAEEISSELSLLTTSAFSYTIILNSR